MDHILDNDIVTRLRIRSGICDGCIWHNEVELEAANEIERLRKILQQVLADAQYKDVLSEWWVPMELALGIIK